MKILEIVTDPCTGRLSHTKIWSNIAYFAATVAFVRLVFSDQPPGLDIWLVYLGVVGAHNVSSQLLSMRYVAGGK